MCGIVGLYAKHDCIGSQLGSLLSKMLVQMGERGPDSAGVAVYRDGPEGLKLSVRLAEPQRREQFASAVTAQFACEVSVLGNHVLLQGQCNDTVQAWIKAQYPDADIMSVGQRVEIYKEASHPRDFVDKHALNEITGSHALGHTRMATESAVTTLGSHPFSTGHDVCLVHNGSLSNHNRLRQSLIRAGLQFKTDNDSEVAAGYLSHRMRNGDSLRSALESALQDLDGFYTFAIGTRSGFAVLRDPIACKPAVLAETDQWVAMASEYRAIAQLPGAEHADVWEPEPARIYTWEREDMAA